MDAELRAGTSGFSYAAWKGSFYPERIAPADMLRFYGERLPAVEINNTFYRLPRESVLAGWAEQVPESFRFVLKASRRITHMKRLREAADETAYLLRTAAALGERLGALLFQLPPNLALDRERLAGFLELLPEGTPAAFEFRHPSWADPAVHELLRSRNLALCHADTDEAEPDALVATADWGYLRLRREDYDDDALVGWAERVLAAPWTRSLVFFKHEDAGAGPRLAARFLDLAGHLAGRRATERVAQPRWQHREAV